MEAKININKTMIIEFNNTGKISKDKFYLNNSEI